MASAPAPIGHNSGSMSPFEAIELHVLDLAENARTMLTGPVTTADQAAHVETLVAEARAAEKAADTARVAEKEPHLTASRAVDARWKPLGDKASQIKASALAALTPYRSQLAAEEAARQALARAEADRIAEAARIAHADANPADLEAVEDAERLLRAAKSADRAATRKTAPTGLRTRYTATVVDPTAYARHLWETERPVYLDWLADRAEKAVNAGARDGLPGVRIDAVKVAA
jgi:hypothetical protein